MNFWQLPQHALHSTYSEWLEWEDLSALDIACVGQTDRQVWLSSIADLHIECGLIFQGRIPADKLINLYQWLGKRKVLVDGFLVRLDVLQHLIEGLDVKSYCPGLHSVQIFGGRMYDNLSNCSYSQVEDNLSVFFSHCHGLEEVIVKLDDQYVNELSKHLNEVILGVLDERLKENSLIKIDLQESYPRDTKRPVMIANLLRKHALSLQELHLSIREGVDVIISTLIESEIHLKVLEVSLGHNLSQPVDSWLLPYLSSSDSSSRGMAMLLEVLEIKSWIETPFEIDHCLVSIAQSCPKLTQLLLRFAKPCSAANLRLLYEQCPHLEYVSIDGSLTTNNRRRTVSILVNDCNNDDWAVCLCYALRRSQFKQAALSLRGDYHTSANIKSMLEPYHLRVDAFAPESSLIALLQDLPHLNSLYVAKDHSYVYTDAILVAITQHAKSLSQLDMSVVHNYLHHFHFSDEALSEMIKTCKLLEILRLPTCAMESLTTVLKHSNLRDITMNVAESVSVEMLNDLLFDENVQRSAVALERGDVFTRSGLYYKFNQGTHSWHTVR
eukprot:scaffold1577_cov284-Ochromonas_danica.AAC.5